MATINILLSSLDGLGLPATLALPLHDSTPIRTFTSLLQERLPANATNLTLHDARGHSIDVSSAYTLSTLRNDDALGFLPLSLSARLLGGKGGFGSQLRAAGGRMASRKNRNGNQRDPNGSNRNLDGRRLRTVTEAKALAEYLATKPELDKKENEEKRKRWESIVESVEKKEEELRSGKKGARLDGEWVERKEEEEGKTRDAVLAMMKAGLFDEGRTGSESDEGEGGKAGSEETEAEASGSGSASSEHAAESGARSFFGWDEEDLSEDEEDDEGDEGKAAPAAPQYTGKGKGRA